MDDERIRELWDSWQEGTSRCPYCVDLCPIEWWCVCDCWMAPEPEPGLICDCHSCQLYRQWVLTHELAQADLPPFPDLL